ncbi:MAG: diacylglycerol kinase family lipid kinase [Gammaproteobacteria bacterium]|nr:MAG: diacylglycerol kinase family lipid kinase [Gammaproteobacteria bacterium]
MPHKVTIICNPRADMGRARITIAALRTNPPACDAEIVWRETRHPHHATELAQAAGDAGHDLIIALGGDGLVHEIVNGLMTLPDSLRPAFGVVPIGSGNDFAHAIGISGRPEEILARLLQSENFRRVDIGQMTDDSGRVVFFDNTLGMGFDAIVTIRSHRLPVIKGFLMYLTAVIQTILLNHECLNVVLETDNGRWEGDVHMLALCNGPREGGGFLLSPDSRNDDGTMEYIAVTRLSRLLMFRLISEFMQGTHRRFPQIHMGTFKRLTLTSDRPLQIHADGEVIADFSSATRRIEVTILPQALQVVI